MIYVCIGIIKLDVVVLSIWVKDIILLWISIKNIKFNQYAEHKSNLCYPTSSLLISSNTLEIPTLISYGFPNNKKEMYSTLLV